MYGFVMSWYFCNGFLHLINLVLDVVDAKVVPAGVHLNHDDPFTHIMGVSLRSEILSNYEHQVKYHRYSYTVLNT